MYDGAEINNHWGNPWPTGNDVHDGGHEFSPVLQAPVVNLLGDPWYLESGSPGGDFVTWLDLADGRSVAVSPHPDDDGLMRWCVGINNEHGHPLHQDHELLITATPQEVVDLVRTVMADNGIS